MVVRHGHFFVIAGLLLHAFVAHADPCDKLHVWTRKVGDYSGGNDIARQDEKVVALGSLHGKTQALFDFQYQAKKTYKAVPLTSVIMDYVQAAKSDLVLLHFRNKMIVPLSLDDKDAFKNKVFIALAIQEDKHWQSEFPLVERSDSLWRDPRPIHFCGHKMVVTQPLAFPLAGQTAVPKEFTPWRYVDSLEGVEFANASAYYAQFDVGTVPQAREGLQVFKNRCQFCHGVQQVGAGMGWDYAGPIPAFEKRQPDSLFLHVKVEKAEKFRLGTLMPAQTDLQKQEANVLWFWLRDAAQNKLKPYQP